MARGTSANAETVQALGTDPRQLLHHVADRIPADAPDRDRRRHQLSLAKAKEAHGLITPEQAEQQRATFRAAPSPSCAPTGSPTPKPSSASTSATPLKTAPSWNATVPPFPTSSLP